MSGNSRVALQRARGRGGVLECIVGQSVQRVCHAAGDRYPPAVTRDPDSILNCDGCVQHVATRAPARGVGRRQLRVGRVS